MAAVASRDQKTAYDGTIASQKKHLVSLSPYEELGSANANFDLSKYKTIFMLSVQNCGKEPISIALDNITVIFEGNSKDWASNKINVQSFDDFIKDFETLYNDNEKYFIYNTLYDDWMLAKTGYFSGEPGKQIFTNRMYQFRKNLKEMRIIKKVVQETLPGIIIKQQTIMSGDTYSGVVICDTRDIAPEIEGNFKVTISVDGEEHKFSFKRSLIK